MDPPLVFSAPPPNLHLGGRKMLRMVMPLMKVPSSISTLLHTPFHPHYASHFPMHPHFIHLISTSHHLTTPPIPIPSTSHPPFIPIPSTLHPQYIPITSTIHPHCIRHYIHHTPQSIHIRSTLRSPCTHITTPAPIASPPHYIHLPST